MAKHERNRGVQVYHSIVAILLLLAGGALLGVGIWLRVTDNRGPLNLQYSGESFFNFVLNISIGAIVVGVFLLVTAVVAMLALARKCIGVTFKAIFVILALIILAALVFICVVSVLVRVKGDSETVRDFVFDAWKLTVENSPDDVCTIETNLNCRGFSDFDCADCTGLICANRDLCAPCSSPVDPSVGCYTRIVNRLRNVFLPSAIVSGILSGVVLFDIIFVFCL